MLFLLLVNAFEQSSPFQYKYWHIKTKSYLFNYLIQINTKKVIHILI